VSDAEHEPSRTRVPMPIATLDDPHLGDMAKNPRRVEGIIAAVFVLAIFMMAAFGAAYWQNWNPWILGGSFGAGLFLLGFGLTAWGKYLMPQGPFVEERHTLAGTPAERDAISAALVERSTVVVKRRRLLGGLFAAGSGIFGIVAIFPLLRSLGPVPGTSFETTDWRRGLRLVDSNGRPIHRDTLRPGNIVTVFPEGYQDNIQSQSMDQTVLIRVSYENFTTIKGRETWAPEGFVAYSKMCTHLGCPVGLYEQELQLLVCPCHQSMFDVTNGAVPQFGPAPRPLPQLPLAINSDGYLVAQSGYHEAVGPGFWERTTT
jgi:ubiquinol-cytochrome c reductase iron-sulfur subunit